jgi:outer membrane protein assembly factor BamB
MPRRLAMAVLLFTFAVPITMAQDWPRFLGPNGSGVSGSTGLPAEFGPAKSLVWKTEVPFARSSPVVAGDRVYLTASEGEKLIVLALDRASGKTLWRRDIVRSRVTPIYKANDAASPSPVSDGENVYAFFADFGLISFEASGKERWRVPLGPFDTFYGLAASPILSGDTLLMLCDARSKPFLLAVDSATGKQRWRVERSEVRYEGYATPLVYEPPSGPAQVIVLGANRLDAYSVKTGEKIWWVRGLAYFPIGSPALGKDVVVVATYGSDNPMGPSYDEFLKGDANKDGKISRDEIKKEDEMHEHFGAADYDRDGLMTREEYDLLQSGAKGDYGLLAVKLGGRGDVTSTHVAWRDKKMYNNLSSLLIYKDVLYVSKNAGIIAALNPSTGEILKVERPKEPAGEYVASPVAADGKIYFASNSGKVVVVKEGKPWEFLTINDLKEEIEATPAIAGRRLFIRTRNALYCFGN